MDGAKEVLAAALLRSLVRKALTYVAGMLLTYGLVNVELANRVTTEGTSLIVTSIITLAISFWLSYKNVITEKVKTIVGIALPPNTTIQRVEEIAKTVENKRAVATGAAPLVTELPNAR